MMVAVAMAVVREAAVMVEAARAAGSEVAARVVVKIGRAHV